MYRSIAYYVISKGADLSDPEQIKPLLGEISIKLLLHRSRAESNAQ